MPQPGDRPFSRQAKTPPHSVSSPPRLESSYFSVVTYHMESRTAIQSPQGSKETADLRKEAHGSHRVVTERTRLALDFLRRRRLAESRLRGAFVARAGVRRRSCVAGHRTVRGDPRHRRGRLIAPRSTEPRPNPLSQRFDGVRRLHFKIEWTSRCGPVSSPPVLAPSKANLRRLPLRAHRVRGRGRTTH